MCKHSPPITPPVSFTGTWYRTIINRRYILTTVGETLEQRVYTVVSHISFGAPEVKLFKQKSPFTNACLYWVFSRVGHRVLLCSERIVLLHSFKASNILFRSFFEYLATYETQKNATYFCKERKEHNVLLQRT